MTDFVDSGGGVRIRSGTHKEAGQSDIVVISAGAKQRKGRHLVAQKRLA